MDTLLEFSTELFSKFGFTILIPIVLFGIVGVGAQFMLYEKCKLPGVACLVPVWNVIVFLKIVGRPWYQSFIVMIPPVLAISILTFGGYDLISIASLVALAILWGGFMIKVYIELCQSFGKTHISDYIFVIIFNGLYVLNLGLAHDAKYKGPVYLNKKSKKTKEKPQLA